MRLAVFIAFIPLLVACSGSTPSTMTGSGTGSGGSGSSSSTGGATTSSSSGTTTTLHGTFACGGGTCDLATQYCERDALDQGSMGVTYEYSCGDLPTPCVTDHTCQCVQQHGVGFIGCTVQSDGSIILDNDLP
jgi:hypothetical protein